MQIELKHNFIIGLLLVWLPLQYVVADPTIPVPWQCSFEETEDLSEWVLNSGTAEAADQWVIGDATRSVGKKSLYISTNNGETAIAGCSRNIVMAYRKLHFPEHATGYREYDISFDWKAMGEGTLYVYFGYYSNLITNAQNMLQYASSTRSDGIPATLMNNAGWVYSSGYSRRQALKGELRWRGVSIDAGEGTTYSVRLSAKNSLKDYALLFVWVNQNLDPAKVDMGACVDNIQIASALYEKPTNLRVAMNCENSGFDVSWIGNISDYSVEYRRDDQASWRRYTHQGAPNKFLFQLMNLKEGTYDIRVRGWRGTDTTAYTMINSQLLLCMDNHCINYINLDKALCQYGRYESSSISATDYTGKIDNGWDDITSFHTVCSDQNAYDYRTNGKLKLIPDGELASVRLGTWVPPGSNKWQVDSTSVNIGGYSITYDLIVDTASQALLLLKYAMVMENPTGHDETQMPFFRLEVLDENGIEIDGTCGSKQFYCPADTTEALDQGWVVYSRNDFPNPKPTGSGLGSVDIFWKDWTTMGVNLAEAGARDGDHLKVRITAKGCTMGGHWGYGYFTLDCASATIETDQCSGNPSAQADAPEGFTYQWYKERNRDLYEAGVTIDPVDGQKIIVSRTPDLQVQGGDTNVYVCRMLDKVTPSCWFELKTRLSPRSPRPMYMAEHIAQSEYMLDAANACRNIVQITDTSRVQDYSADGTIHISTEACEFSDFTVRSLVSGKTTTSSNSVFTVLTENTGDTLEVTQTSYIANGECSATKVDTIVVMDITTPDSVWSDTVCRNIGYVFHGKKLIATGTYDYLMKNRFGCDSVETIHLQVNPISDSTIVDTISSLNLPYVLSGIYKGDVRSYERGMENAYITTQNYSVKFSNTYDCDSTINLSLTVIPQLIVDAQGPAIACADDRMLDLSYIILHGDFDSMRISFDSLAHTQHFRDTVIYHNPYAPIETSQDVISFPYAKSIVPGVYQMKAVFYRHPSCGENISFNFPMDIRYASSIIQQKWNDVLALQNAELNGGFRFTKYQWYKDGDPISGATGPYLYEPLDMHASYCVRLTRDDGVSQYSCVMMPKDRTPLTKTQFPTFAKIGNLMPVYLSQPAQVQFYTPAGILVMEQSAGEGNVELTMPPYVGYYIVTLLFNDGTQENHKVLVAPK